MTGHKTVPGRGVAARLWGRLRRMSLYNLLIYVILLNLSFIFLYAFLYMLVTSFKSYSDLMDVTVKWLPREFHPQNWLVALQKMQLPASLFNSVFVSLLATLGHVASCSLAAYGFARFRFPFRNLLFVLVVITIIVPVQTIIVPQYVLYNHIGWYGNFASLIVPAFLGQGLKGGLFIFLFRQFFLRLPPALEEAASIDGCTPYGTFLRIILPTSGPVLLVCTVLSVVWHWNDFFEPSIYLNDAKNFLLPQTLPQLQATVNSLQTAVTQESLATRETFTAAVVMAGAAICVIPLLILFGFIQNKFIESIDRTGLVE